MSQRKYKHIFFDLDRTLWDFEGNSVETLKDLQRQFKLDYIDESEFRETFHFFNELHWKMFREGRIKKEGLRKERFNDTLKKFGIVDNSLSARLSEEYIRLGPTKSGLMPYAKEVLERLKHHYTLYIITNGFLEVQSRKMNSSGIESYFKKVISSEMASASKPAKGIFEYALSSANAKKNESIMVGDDLELDILGAKKFGIDQVYFNPSALTHIEKVTFEIKSLLELSDILP